MMAPCSVKANGGNRGSRCFWEPVAICDRFRVSTSGAGEAEHEILWKPLGVALDLFVEALGGDAVEASQLGIQDDLWPRRMRMARAISAGGAGLGACTQAYGWPGRGPVEHLHHDLLLVLGS